MVKKERQVNKENRQLIDNYLNMLYGDNKSNNTITNYRIDLEIFVDYMESKELTVLDATLEQLDGYKAYLRTTLNSRGEHNSERTRARRISSLKAFYEYLCDRDYIVKDPARKLTIPKIESGEEPIFLTLKESQKLIKSTKGETHEIRDKAILMTFLTTGMRLSELANLNINSITGTTITIKQGKGNKTRKVNISQELADAVEEYLVSRNFSGEALFISQKGNRMSVSAIQNMVKKYMDKIGLDINIYSTHKIRHTFAVLMLQNGDDITIIRESLGHASLKTTQIYTHVLDETKQKSADKMGKLFKK